MQTDSAVTAFDGMEIEVFYDDDETHPLDPIMILRVEGNTIVTSCQRPHSSAGHRADFRYTFIDGMWRESFSDGRVAMDSTRIVKQYKSGKSVLPQEQTNDE